jgi:hypothetical protein
LFHESQFDFHSIVIPQICEKKSTSFAKEVISLCSKEGISKKAKPVAKALYLFNMGKRFVLQLRQL